ncbi:diacylglycerol/lipid kinase family protein [Microbacterium aerolatum]|uniref:Sphingosine kinase n=1 Tax=Microbacterium aerolatum TaxID=153731 RepID=A0A511AFH2_9MICO|nr:diacylglycerol kinase family protein [Microbacterium aerolatum]MCK3768856.1 NAD(+)/NADH kinase [Microbacterium aerolatum]GEK86133.1 sphingosine kinase [Microbacterium aerolatum]GGB26641.1 sphingosine kinase [Microbacterium aerolatum]
MTATSYGLIWNPSKVDEEKLRKAVAEHLGDDVRWWETTPDDPGHGMAQDAVAAGCSVVIAVGGDGTVRAVAETLAGTDAALGIVPQGTGNLLARNLDVPLENIPAALRRIKGGEPRQIDLGWVRTDDGERAFAVMVGFGVDAQMLVETDDDLKDRAGWLAYVEAMGRAMAGTEMTGVTLTIDDGEPQEVRGHTLLIGNCGMVQGGVRLLPDAKLDDGRLDLLLVSADGALQWLDTVRSVVWDNGIRRILTRGESAVSTESTQHLTAERVRVELEQPLAFEVDGEEFGEVSSFEVRVQAGALNVL